MPRPRVGRVRIEHKGNPIQQAHQLAFQRIIDAQVQRNERLLIRIDGDAATY
jgi:hypothetical protein